MLFHTFEFAALLALVLPLHWLAGRFAGRFGQNSLLLAASYVFYGWWDVRFLGLLWISTAVDFAVGRALGRTDSARSRRRLVGLSLASNLGILGFFKYWDLFASTGNGIGSALGAEAALLPELQLILPVGISFYTFQTLSYSIDVYRRHVAPTSSLLDFALYVGFFPQLVAGPIERPRNLLPALERARKPTFRDLEVGLFLFATGWLRKSLGDALARVADPGFADPEGVSPWTLIWGLYAFSFQIYLDFSGYTDMARGVARMLGIRLMRNFEAPYLSTSVREFWQRWHISLSTWLRDYLYISLGGNRRGTRRTLINLMLTMLLGGLWHGAGWNFVVWGALHGSYLVIGRVVFEGRSHGAGATPASWARRVGSALVTFHLVAFAWIFFRAQAVGEVGAFEIASMYAVSALGVVGAEWLAPPVALWVPFLVLATDGFQRHVGRHYLVDGAPAWFRGLATAILLLAAYVFSSGDHRAFVYFQF